MVSLLNKFANAVGTTREYITVEDVLDINKHLLGESIRHEFLPRCIVDNIREVVNRNWFLFSIGTLRQFHTVNHQRNADGYPLDHGYTVAFLLKLLFPLPLLVGFCFWSLRSLVSTTRFRIWIHS